MFEHEGKKYSILRTNDITSEGTPIFTFAVWNNKGQMIDAGEIVANSLKEAKERILGL